MRRRFNTSIFKKFVIKHYENSSKPSKRRTSIDFGISRSCVIDWLKEKDEIMSQKSFSRRKFVESTKVKKALYHDAEGELHKFFEIQREQSVVITTFSIQNKMNELMRVMHPEDSIVFRASRGWVQNFMERYNLAFRRITTSGRELPKIKVIDWMRFSAYMDAPGSYSIAKKGSKRVAAKTSGKEKTRLSCLMTATASGRKLPIV
jgi:hypothetical protein